MPSNKNLLRVASGSAGLADLTAIANPTGTVLGSKKEDN